MPASIPTTKYEWWSTGRALRVAFAIAGGWLFIDLAVAALSMILIVFFDLERRDTVVLLPMLGFLFYLCFLLWAFAVHSVKRLAVVVIAGSALCYGIARLLMVTAGPSIMSS